MQDKGKMGMRKKSMFEDRQTLRNNITDIIKELLIWNYVIFNIEF